MSKWSTLVPWAGLLAFSLLHAFLGNSIVSGVLIGLSWIALAIYIATSIIADRLDNIAKKK